MTATGAEAAALRETRGADLSVVNESLEMKWALNHYLAERIYGAIIPMVFDRVDQVLLHDVIVLPCEGYRYKLLGRLVGRRSHSRTITRQVSELGFVAESLAGYRNRCIVSKMTPAQRIDRAGVLSWLSNNSEGTSLVI